MGSAWHFFTDEDFGAFEETSQLDTMVSAYKSGLLILTFTICGVLYRLCNMDTYQYVKNNILEAPQMRNKADPNLSNITIKTGILFLETTDKVEPAPLVVCSVEAAARLNPDKPIYYFMKGFSGNLTQYPQPDYAGIPLLSSISNVVLLPLKPTELFEGTPLNGWYQKVNPNLERYWNHVLADGCRLALLWKYGGIYLDTDIISMKTLPFANFTCSQGGKSFNNAAIGFHVNHHPFMLDCMEDFVAHYIGHAWGQQGPKLITRVLKRWCKSNDLEKVTGKECNGISLWISRRFYPIPYQSWEKYYVPWKREDIESFFSGTYGVHIWNYMNSKKRKVVSGSGSLIEYLFQMYCPTTYRNLIQSRNSSESLSA
ncbi:alpha-1,4-N-acetylglucosaminyltransferase-like isoform X1 [Heterodontus francisci]|uniref:alpha-1,4-N-acetylglucosaminyltransferase-like isoform X1 n=2 Tax=Heterodontus francisci TaxID=7792 RepID=UPI00355B13B0